MNCGPANAADPPRIVIERPAPDSTAPRSTDPADAPFQAKVDSLNRVMEQNIGKAILTLESNFEDPKTEEEVGRMIGMIIMEQQLALLDIEIDRALSMRDTLLIKGFELGLQELLHNSPEVREALHQQVDALESRFRVLRVETPAVKKE